MRNEHYVSETLSDDSNEVSVEMNGLVKCQETCIVCPGRCIHYLNRFMLKE